MAGEVTIHPTHTCFDDAMEFLNNIALHGADRKVLEQHTVVHAIVEADPVGRHAHAWLEKGDEVGFAGLIDGKKVFCWCDKTAFYRGVRVVKSAKYTVCEAVLRTRASGSTGPWIEEYKTYCKDD